MFTTLSRRGASPVRLCALLALAALAPVARAGNARHVGTGQTYANIQDAINASLDGDIVIVHPGTYPRFQVGSAGMGPKQLSIVPSNVTYVVAPSAGNPEILVENIPFGKCVTILGAQTTWNDPAAPAVVVRNNNGAVRLGALDVLQSPSMPSVNVSATVEVSSTRTFWLSDSSIWNTVAPLGDTLQPLCVNSICNDGISGLQLTDSSGAIQNSRVRGYDNTSTSAATRYGGDGMRLIGECSVWMLENVVGGAYPARFSGGDGIYGGHAVHQVRTPTAPAMNRSCGSGASPNWDPGSRIMAGVGAVGGFYGFNNTNGAVSAGGGPVAFQVPQHCILDEAVESNVQSSLVPIGNDVVVSVRTATARRYVTLISDSTRHHRIAGIAGRAFVNENRILFSSTGVTTAQTVLSTAYPVPPLASLIGLQVTTQTATGPIGGALNAFTVPALVVIGP